MLPRLLSIVCDSGSSVTTSSKLCTSLSMADTRVDNPNVGWSAVAGRLEPLCGWPIHHVMDQVTSSNGIRHHGVPCNDIYGSLYFHVRDRILSAVAKIRACKIAFHFSDHQSRVQYLNDVITQGPGAGSIHIANRWQPLPSYRHRVPSFVSTVQESIILACSILKKAQQRGAYRASLSSLQFEVARC